MKYVSGHPTAVHQVPFHYCTNQTMKPHADLEKYKRLDDGRYKALFIDAAGYQPDVNDRAVLRMYTALTYHATLLERLLTVRTEWSKK